MKKCIKCELELSLDSFYKHNGMSDGHLNKCKECVKKESKIRETNLRLNPDWIEKEKIRQREKYYRLGYKNTTNSNTSKKREIIQRYNKKFPEKALARKYTEIFLQKKSEYNLHHWSYNQEHWLDVLELTIKDHHFLHRYIIYDQERMMYRTLDGVLLDSKNSHFEYFNFCKINYK